MRLPSELPRLLRELVERLWASDFRWPISSAIARACLPLPACAQPESQCQAAEAMHEALA